MTALHEVGCAAVLQTAQEHADGTYDVVTVGGELFRLDGLVHDRSYLVGDVTWRPDEVGDADEAAVLADSVRPGFGAYVQALAAAGAGEAELPDLPGDPLVLSHLVAATALLDLDERQALLAPRTAPPACAPTCGCSGARW